jgi:septal ring factor EnvC (AmiA/AmiB activator)
MDQSEADTIAIVEKQMAERDVKVAALEADLKNTREVLESYGAKCDALEQKILTIQQAAKAFAEGL